ncbi:E-selectin-like isoform X4 [Xyrauchen texanus]|uniref:E-selectin-like isoform X4 n=1 Tax=Xyrauchen texanus TaxID=154827 RepID=UPI002241F501|nr:E-selectin-like isoform X4 [Xyrauchen texanus]
MGFYNNVHRAKHLQFFASLVLISSVLNMWRGTEGWSYHHSEKRMNWELARNWCRQHYTDMVAIQNKEENYHLNNFLPSAKTGYYWIGIRKMNGNWTWVGTNKQLSQKAENWASNEPNNGGNNEDCVEIYIKRMVDAGKWNDMSCRKENTALCYTASCKNDSCISGHGECVETINNHTCSCFEGFYGERCEHVVKCKPEDITTPDHGSVQCSHPNGQFSYDSQCEYSCEEGYNVKGSTMTRCTSTKEWSSKPPTCELVQCPELTKLQEGTLQCHHPKGNFSYQSTCEFGCDEGYTLGESSTSALFCGANGHWNDSQSNCEIVQCLELTKPQEGTMQCHHPMGNFSYKSTCEFVCEEGYTFGDFSSSTLFCAANGHWNGSQPYCEIVKCKPEDITTADHGSVQCSHPNGQFSYDSQCEYSCEEGYNVKGSTTTRCTSTKEWSSKPPTCELVQCPELTKPQEGTLQCHHPKGNFSYQSTCEFGCDEGYTLGESSTSTLFCGANGHWNDSQSNCEIVQCLELTKPQEGTMQCHHPMGNFSYKSTCEFVCEEGYTFGDFSSSTLFCGANGHWNDSQPYCEIVKCKPEDITTPDHGSVQCSHPNGQFSYDSQCEYSCEEGYNVKGSTTTRCTSTNEWSSKPPTCELVQCPELTKPQEGTLQCHDPKGNFSFQSTCEFVCKEGYTLRNPSSSTLFCGITGRWNDSQPNCEIVKCKPEDITTPDHGSVHCSHPNGNFSYDSQCKYSCEEGYNVTGSSTTTCTSTIEWSSRPPTCEPHPEALVTEVTLGVAAAVGSSSLFSVLWILKKLRRNANKFDLNSNSETEDHPPVYKNSIDSLI